MYLEINEKKYQCSNASFGRSLIWYGVEDLNVPVEDTIITCRDDGFVMREDDPKDWLRQVYENDTLILTNDPVPPEPPDPPDPPPAPPDPFEMQEKIEEICGRVTELEDQLLPKK